MLETLVEDTSSGVAPKTRDMRKTALNPEFWYPIARSVELRPGTTHACSFAGDPIVLIHGKNGAAFALEDRCAHRQVPLSAGIVDGDTVRCGYHGWAYDASGACAVPYASECAARPRGLRSFPCREAYGRVFVFPGEAARAPDVPLPDIPSARDARYKIRYLNRRANCHYSFMHENLMDMNHQFLHRKLMGGIKTYLLDSRAGKAWAEATYGFRRVSGKQPIGAWLILNRGKCWKKRPPLPPEVLATPPGDRMVIRTDYPYQTLKFWTAGAEQPALDLWNCYPCRPRAADQSYLRHDHGPAASQKSLPSRPDLAGDDLVHERHFRGGPLDLRIGAGRLRRPGQGLQPGNFSGHPRPAPRAGRERSAARGTRLDLNG